MYQLRFYQDNTPPVLNNGFQDIVESDEFGYSYIIGSPNDPHWNIYPMDDYLKYSVENFAPMTYVFTNYIADANHYLYYAPNYNNQTNQYAKLLKEHLGKVSRYVYVARTPDDAYKSRLIKINEERRKRLQQVNKVKIKEINTLIKKENEDLEKVNSKLKTAKDSRDREIRMMVKEELRNNKDNLEIILSSLNKKDKKYVRDEIMARLNSEQEAKYDSTNDLYSNLLTKRKAIEKNIEFYEKELKKYTE